MKVSPSLYSSKLPTLETVNLVRNTLSEYIHIDVKDVPNLDRVAHDIKIVRDRSDLFIDIHLIDSKPESKIEQLLKISPDFLAIQFEDMNNPESFFSMVEKLKDTNVGISITRKTPFSDVDRFIKKAQYVLLMTTIPGESGGVFDDNCLKWIESFRNRYPDKRVHVDGGVDDLVSKKIRNLNISCVVSGSYLMKAESMIASVMKIKGIPTEERLTKYMLPVDHIPVVESSCTLLESLSEISKGLRGFCIVRDKDSWGILTDGDIRRALIKTSVPAHILKTPVKKIVNYKPFSIDHQETVEMLLLKLIQEKFDKKLKFVVLTCYNEPVGILDFSKLSRS